MFVHIFVSIRVVWVELGITPLFFIKCTYFVRRTLLFLKGLMNAQDLLKHPPSSFHTSGDRHNRDLNKSL